MKVRTRLRLGFGFLFLVVLFFGAASLFYISDISDNAKVILTDNYDSLDFSREIRSVFEDNTLPLTKSALREIETQVIKQEHNITEKGEREATMQLRSSFNKLVASALDPVAQQFAIHDIYVSLRKIEKLNMAAIVRKNDYAQKSVSSATLFLGLIGTFAFLLLFTFSVNFPDYIANPLRSLLEGIREVGEKNYSKRLDFTRNDEFSELANAFNLMASRLNEWETSNLATVISEKRRIEAIIDQMQDAIIGIDAKHEILFMNDAARKTLNLTDSKIIGQNADKLAGTNDLFNNILNSKATIKPFKIVLDSRESYFQLQSSDILIPNLQTSSMLSVASKSAGKVYILKNITEFKERDEAKTNFIATISHELKTPIASIKMSLKLLNDKRVGSLNTEQLQLVEHVKDDSERLLKITSELLELSQVETGNIQLNFMPVDPIEIVDYALSSIKLQADQKNVLVEIIKPDNLPQVHADIEKTAWVLVNFLSNALRYSAERSKIVITIREQGRQVEFAVKDFGRGIDEAYQKRLFDRYFQVPTDGQNKSGSGLGLAISKDFITAQGGIIGVESEIGAGSRFYFTLVRTTA